MKKFKIMLMITISGTCLLGSVNIKKDSLNIGDNIPKEIKKEWISESDSYEKDTVVQYTNLKEDMNNRNTDSIMIEAIDNKIISKRTKFFKNSTVKEPFKNIKGNVTDFYSKIIYKAEGGTTNILNVAKSARTIEEAEFLYKETINQAKELSKDLSYVKTETTIRVADKEGEENLISTDKRIVSIFLGEKNVDSTSLSFSKIYKR